jgi:hypothetical protein
MTVKELRPGDPGYEEARAKAIENVTADPRKIPVAQWSRDHWSLLAYIECRCVDNNGTVDKKHMRCNEFRHPMHAVNRRYGDLSAWSAANGTRAKLAKPIKIDGKAVDVVRVAAHDDWDVLNELEDAGLVDVVSGRRQSDGRQDPAAQDQRRRVLQLRPGQVTWPKKPRNSPRPKRPGG